MQFHSNSQVSRLSSLALFFSSLLIGCGGGNDQSSADANVSAMSGDRKYAQSVPAAIIAPLVINEVSAANWKDSADEDGDASDWVEIYNPTSAEVSLNGYALSNKSSTLFQWLFPTNATIPADGYLTVWLSKKNRTVAGLPLHASFNLDNGGETLFLSASTGSGVVAVDSTRPPKLHPDVTWCRMPGAAATATTNFQICMTATRDRPNAGVTFPAMLATPALSVASGIYANGVSVAATGPSGATIRYTLDGSEPTELSPEYTQPIGVAASAVLRARAYSATAAPSFTESAHYVVDSAATVRYAALRKVFVAMSPADLQRFNSRDKSLVAPIAIEMFSGNTRLFKARAEGKVAGQLGSTDSSVVSMNVAMRDALGFKDVSAVLWPEKPFITSTKKFRLRNGSNDWASAHLRDQFAQSVSDGGPNLAGSSGSVVVYMNGAYYGLMDLREREDETLPSNNHSLDNDHVDDLDDPLLAKQEINNGGASALTSYAAMHNFVTGTDMSVAVNYAQATTLMRPESLAWDWATHHFQGNYDWPSRNVHVWRSPAYDGRWNWHPHDMDFSFGRYADANRDMGSSYTSTGSELFNALLANRDFRSLYLNALADQMNLQSAPRLNARLDVMSAEMRPYIAEYFGKYALGNEANWSGHLNDMRAYFLEREQVVDRQSRDLFSLPQRSSLNVQVNDLNMGTVKVNLLDVGKLMKTADPSFTGRYYPGLPLSLNAQPKPGFRFVGWQGAATGSSRSTQLTLPTTALVPSSNFSVRWTGQLLAPVSGGYVLQTRSDEGVRVWLNGRLVIDNWTAHQLAADFSASVQLVAGQRYDLKVEYFQLSGPASVRLLWTPPGATTFAPISAADLFPDAAAARSGGLTGEYFSTPDLSGVSVATSVEAVDFAWDASAPMPSAMQVRALFAANGTPQQPIVEAVTAQSGSTGQFASVQVTASDPEGLPLTYRASSLPKGLDMQASTGMIYGRLTTPGSYASTVTVSNGSISTVVNVQWTISNGVPSSDFQQGGRVPCALETQICVLPFRAVANVYYSANGSSAVRRQVTDRIACSDASFRTAVPGAGKKCSYEIVAAGNLLPEVALSSPTAGPVLVAGSAIAVMATASDEDGSVTRVDFYAGTILIGSATQSPYMVQWTPTVGTHELTAVATDNAGGSATSAAVTVTAAVPGSAPTRTFCANENQTCVLPVGARADVHYGASGRFSVQRNVVGSIACSNAVFGDPIFGVAKTCAFEVVVLGVGNQAPTVALSSPTVGASLVGGSGVSVTALAADVDGSVTRVDFYAGSTLIGSAAQLPFAVQWTPAAGTYALTAVAADNSGATTTSSAVTVTVTAPAGNLARTFCANQGQTCVVPVGARADVYFGVSGRFFVRRDVVGSIACTSAEFGNPVPGVPKTCEFVLVN